MCWAPQSLGLMEDVSRFVIEWLHLEVIVD
jgi:hypothetical protein